MFQHGLLLIYRNFKRFKSTFFINLVGLSTGLACALAIYLWVDDELLVDKFHENDRRLFQVMEHQSYAGGMLTGSETPAFLAETLAEEMPEVEYAAVSTPPFWFPKLILSVGDRLVKAPGLFVGSDYLQVFSYPLTQGNKREVLKDKNAVVISEQLAMSLFNTTENILGKTLVWQFNNLKKISVISGVFKGTPSNSSIRFDFLLSFELFKEIMSLKNELDSGGPFITYLTLKEGSDVEAFNAKITRLMEDRFKDGPRHLFLKPYSSIYLYGAYEDGVLVGGRIEYVRMFSAIALFILIIACINFMNLSTAKASRRIKEVGIKKAIGASRKSLILHYLGESTLLTFLSVLIALLLVTFFLPQFNVLTGKQLALRWDGRLALVLLGITLLTGLVAGSYPALYLSGFNPIAVLKGTALTAFSPSVGERWARKGLVVFQFTLSVVFIVAVLVVYKQVEYVQTKPLGYDKDHVIQFESEGQVSKSCATFLSEVQKLPGVVSASAMVGNVVGGPGGGLSWKGKDGRPTTIQFKPMQGTYGLIETLGIRVKKGRTFSRDFGDDDAKVICNEAAVKALELEAPLGKIIPFGDKNFEIIGVVKDFHYQSLHEEVKPAFFRLESPEGLGTVVIKLKAGREKETLGRLLHFYKAYNPGFSFDYTFLDEDFQAQYVAERRVSVLSRYFAGLAILISCLGLFGLAAFSTERRWKEIGIRKVFGASEFKIVYLLSRDFAKLVLTSVLVALPLSYLITRHWLASFVYKIELEPWYFLSAGLIVFLLAWLTVGIQAFKAARVNPSQCLRDE